MRAVNLLPPDERRKGLDESARKPLLLAGGGIAVVTVLATLVAVLASLEASDTRSRLDAVEAEIAALPEPQEPALDASTLAQERTDRVSALAVALTGRIAFDRLLRQVALVLPEDAWLTRLDAAAPIPEAPATPGSGAGAAPADEAPGVTIEGATWSHDRVAVVFARLSAIPTLQALVSAGAFDSLKPSARACNEWRSALHSCIDPALARAQRAKRERLQGQNGLFGAVIVDETPEEVPQAKGWTATELLAAEKNALGFYITGHPLANYVDLLQSLKAAKSIELPNLRSGGRISIGGIISDLQPKTTKKGDRVALLRLEDESGGTKCVLWPETYRKHSNLVRNEAAVLITGRLELSEENPPNIIADQVQSLDDLQKNQELVVLQLPASEQAEPLFDSVLHLISSNPGNCDVAVETQLDAGIVVRVKVNSSLRVNHSAKLEAELKELGCRVRVERAAYRSFAASDNGR